MGTRANIGFMQPDGMVKTIYSHWDGYPEHMGRTLEKYYNSAEKAQALVALGDISSLRPRLAPNEGEAHSYEQNASGVTVAYHRDRGEAWEPVAPRTVPLAQAREQEWLYVFKPDEGRWLGLGHSSTELVPIERLIELDNEE